MGEIVVEDKSVVLLEALGKEIESLRKELVTARDRIHFLEERIAIIHEKVFNSPQPKDSGTRPR